MDCCRQKREKCTVCYIRNPTADVFATVLFKCQSNIKPCKLVLRKFTIFVFVFFFTSSQSVKSSQKLKDNFMVCLCAFNEMTAYVTCGVCFF